MNHKSSTLIKSEVEYTITLDCCLKDFSSDQMAQSNFNAAAKYGISPMCLVNFEASGIKAEYSEEFTILINLNNISLVSEKSTRDLNFFLSTSSLDLNSSFSQSGEHKLISSESIILRHVETFRNAAISTFASITKIIHLNPCLLAMPCLIFADTNLTSSSVSLLPAVNSSSFLIISSLLTFSDNMLRITSDQFIR